MSLVITASGKLKWQQLKIKNERLIKRKTDLHKKKERKKVRKSSLL